MANAPPRSWKPSRHADERIAELEAEESGVLGVGRLAAELSVRPARGRRAHGQLSKRSWRISKWHGHAFAVQMAHGPRAMGAVVDPDSSANRVNARPLCASTATGSIR